jgi:hypothetical protein
LILPPHHCNGCANRWNGCNTCHCAGCHMTFTNIRAFDHHRRSGRCLPPATVGLVQSGRSYECWEQRDERPHPFSLLVPAADGLEALGQYDHCGATSGGAQISNPHNVVAL